MSEQYGALELSASTLTIIAIVGVVTLAMTLALHAMDAGIVAFIPHVIGFTAISVLVATMWTNQTWWNEGGPLTFFLGAVLVVAAAFVPFFPYID